MAEKKKPNVALIVVLTIAIIATAIPLIWYFYFLTQYKSLQDEPYSTYNYSTTYERPTTNVTATPIESEPKQEKTFDFGDGSWEYNDLYTVYTGKITNISKSTHRFVKVKGTFQDENENAIDTDSTYACGDEGLEPGETTTFRLSTKANPAVKKIHMQVYDYR